MHLQHLVARFSILDDIYGAMLIGGMQSVPVDLNHLLTLKHCAAYLDIAWASQNARRRDATHTHTHILQVVGDSLHAITHILFTRTLEADGRREVYRESSRHSSLLATDGVYSAGTCLVCHSCASH